MMQSDICKRQGTTLRHGARASLALCLAFAAFSAFAGDCRVGEVWPSSRSVFYPEQAVYGDQYKAIKTHITFGPDAAVRISIRSGYPFYVIVVRHAGSATEKALEGDAKQLSGNSFEFEFTANYRDYPKDEMELLLFAGEHYQTTRFKMDLTYTTVACK